MASLRALWKSPEILKNVENVAKYARSDYSCMRGSWLEFRKDVFHDFSNFDGGVRRRALELRARERPSLLNTQIGRAHV